ncbi:hypothetical protein Patl1_17190 [Pistacia atlantica]|uniref:Uncharacterized protein n=1 Tax=Pistacia atlantica TaxID=434234 RepID=A0ACC1B763_9ROSI|nr:hypothetical protein Patl1_17190 [Pistacia atlantica]
MTMTHHFAGSRSKNQRLLNPVFTTTYGTLDRAVQLQAKAQEKEELKYRGRAGNDGIGLVNPQPHKGLASKAIDFLETMIVKFMYNNSSLPLYYLSGNFAPVPYETPPTANLHVIGHLPI